LYAFALVYTEVLRRHLIYTYTYFTFTLARVTQVMLQAVRIFSKASHNNVQIAAFPQGVLKKVSRKLLSTLSPNIDLFSDLFTGIF